MDHRLQGSPTFLPCKLDAREDLQTKNSIRVRWVSDGQYQCILLCTSMCFYVLLFSNAVDNKALPWCHLFSGFSGFSGFRASRTGRWALGPSRYSWRSAIMSSCTKIRIGSEHWSSARSKDKCNMLNYVELPHWMVVIVMLPTTVFQITQWFGLWGFLAQVPFNGEVLQGLGTTSRISTMAVLSSSIEVLSSSTQLIQHIFLLIFIFRHISSYPLGLDLIPHHPHLIPSVGWARWAPRPRARLGSSAWGSASQDLPETMSFEDLKRHMIALKGISLASWVSYGILCILWYLHPIFNSIFNIFIKL